MRLWPALLLLALHIGLGDPAFSVGARLYKSGPIQITANGSTVWVVNPDNDSVSRIDTSTEAVVEIPLPDPATRHSPHGLAVKDDGSEVWVACRDSDRIYVLDGTSGALLERIDLPWGTGPYSVALAPPAGAPAAQTLGLVTGFRSGRVVALDLPARRIAKILAPIFRSPLGIAFADDGSAWITHLFADGEHPRISRVELSGPGGPVVSTKSRVFAVHPQNSNNTAPRRAEGGYVTLRGHPAQVPAGEDGGRLWLPVQYQNIHESSPSPESAVQSTIRKVDLPARRLVGGRNDASNPDHPAKVILTAVDVHDPTASGSSPVFDGPGWNAEVSGAVDLAFGADGLTAFVLHEQSEDVVVMATSTPPVRPAGASPLTEIPVGKRPMGIVTSPSTNRAYVSNVLSRSVSVLDLASSSELRRIPVTPVTGEPFPAARLRGARIFHSSNEDEISLNRKVACASCHINGEHDGRIWDLQHLPGDHGPRSTPTLLGLGATFGPVDPATGWGQLHRSGDRDELQDFEHTFQGAQMGGSGFLGGAVQPELGPPNGGLSNDLDALSGYLASLPAAPRSPFRSPGGGLSEAAVRGATFFKGSDPSKAADAMCATCHVPATGFVDFLFHDVGQAILPGENELDTRSPANHVNTATLVGLWTTPPYDGVAGFAETLPGALLDFKNRPGARAPHGRVDNLTGRQLQDLNEFLSSIDGDLTADDVAAALDNTPPRIVRVAPTSPTRIEVWFDESVDRISAENPIAWSIVDLPTAQSITIQSASLDPQNEDRVTLVVDPPPGGCGVGSFELRVLGPIFDLADRASGGSANALVDSPPVSYTLGNELTVTLGGSGHENLTVPVHDASTIPGLQTWSHGSIWLGSNGGNPNTGFLRFEWAGAFQAATAVTSATAISSAVIHLHPDLGNTEDLEARRVLQPWFDHRRPDFANNPVDPATGRGGPTWRQSEHGVRDWNTNNARATTPGVEGDDPADYGGGADTAFTPDAVVTLGEIGEPFSLSGTKITEAFRFWFDNPPLDYGYALRMQPGSSHAVRFERVEHDFKDLGASLEITYRQPLLCGVIFADGFESGNTGAWSVTAPGVP